MKKRSYLIIFIILLIFLLTYNNIDFNKITGYATRSDFSEKDSSENNPTESDFIESSSTDYACPDCNVIILLLDALRADHLGAYGYYRETSPNIDKLAEEGILFENMLAQSSWTKPGTASILTGLFPKNHQAILSPLLAEEKVLLSEILKENKYDTHAFIANAVAGRMNGFDQGYDNFYDFNDFQELKGNAYPPADWVNEKLINFINNLNKTSKQFIYVHYNDPHSPYKPKEKHFSILGNITFTEELEEELHHRSSPLSDETVQGIINLYDDEIMFNDKMIGNLLQSLKEKEMNQNSIIIIISDHGEEFHDHEGFFHGESLYDEMLLIPGILWIPQGKHQIIEKQVNQIDIIPTILSLLNVPIPDNLDGVNVLDDNLDNEFSYAEFSDEKGSISSSVRSLDDKLILSINQNPEGNEIVWTGQELELTVVSEESEFIEIPVFSLLDEQLIQITLNGKEPHVIPIKVSGTMIKEKIRKNIPTRIHFTSFRPCTMLSDFGSQHPGCYNFGIIPPSSLKSNSNYFVPLYQYYDLKNSASEINNLYFSGRYDERIKKLRKKSIQYHQTRERKISSEEPIQYSDEELEALKALGYI